jgi:hypothetical protein
MCKMFIVAKRHYAIYTNRQTVQKPTLQKLKSGKKSRKLKKTTPSPDSCQYFPKRTEIKSNF